MEKERSKPENIDDYIAGFQEPVRQILERLRETIRAAAPEAQEAISYQIPTFKLNGNLVHFAGYKNHIGFYPTSSGIAKFRAELDEFELSKGTVRFPLDKPIPYELISKIVAFRVMENSARAAAKDKRAGGS